MFKIIESSLEELRAVGSSDMSSQKDNSTLKLDKLQKLVLTRCCLVKTDSILCLNTQFIKRKVL